MKPLEFDPGSVLVIDFNNAVYRARAGFHRGDHAVTYTFMLMLRKLVERVDPSEVFIVLEGHPRHRHELLPSYKEGRASPGDSFWSQHTDIIGLMSHLPVHVVRHPDLECDDVIAHVVRVMRPMSRCTVVSTDTDFIQLLDTTDSRIKLYNPVKDVFVPATSYDYVMWKSLTGDGTDGVPGFKGIGPARAAAMLGNSDKLADFLSDADNRAKFDRNVGLIVFADVPDGLEEVRHSLQPSELLSAFKDRGFKSLLEEKRWTRFTSTFEAIEFRQALGGVSQ